MLFFKTILIFYDEFKLEFTLEFKSETVLDCHLVDFIFRTDAQREVKVEL